MNKKFFEPNLLNGEKGIYQMTENEMKNQNLMKKTIEEFNLSDRAYNSLTRAGISTIGEIDNMTDEELIKEGNLGQKVVVEIRQKIARLVAEQHGGTKNYVIKKSCFSESIECSALCCA